MAKTTYVTLSSLKHYDEKIKEVIEDKQDQLIGTEGQIVSFDADGNVISKNLDTSDLSERITSVEESIETLNGTGEGSIEKIIDNAFNEFATNVSNDNVVNTYKELIDYAAEHDSDIAEIVADIEGLENRTGNIETELGSTIRNYGSHTTIPDGTDGKTGFSLNIKSSGGISSYIQLTDETNDNNKTNIYPAQIITPLMQVDNMRAKTSGGKIKFQSNVEVNDLTAASATIPQLDGNILIDGSVNINGIVVGIDGFDGDLNGTASGNLPLAGGSMNKNATITLNSSGLSGGVHLKDESGYQTTLTADCLHVQDDEGNTSTVGGSAIYSPKFVGDLTGTASKATALSNTSAIGSSTKPVYIDANGAPTAISYTLGAACAKGVATTVASGNTNLVTSGAVYTTTAPIRGYNFKGGYHSGSNTYGTDSSTYYGNTIMGHLGDFSATSLYMNAFYGYEIKPTGGGYCSAAFGSIITISSKINSSLVVGNSHNLRHQTTSSIIAGSGHGSNVAMTNAFMFGNNLSNGSYCMAIGHYNSAISGVSSGTTNYAFCVGNGTAEALGNAFLIDYDGETHADGAYTTMGADYAEFVEWEDGNVEAEERIAKFVTLHGENIAIANEGDYIAGVISATPSVIGNNPLAWTDKYLKDEFGRYLTKEVIIPHIDEITGDITEEKTIERIVNQDYNPDLEYIMREDRIEWAPVGMLGFLRIYDDGTCQVDGYCKCADGGIATAANIEDNTFLTPIYRVVKRISDNIIEIYFR